VQRRGAQRAGTIAGTAVGDAAGDVIGARPGPGRAWSRQLAAALVAGAFACLLAPPPARAIAPAEAEPPAAAEPSKPVEPYAGVHYPDDYDPLQAAHPVRIAAYILHPVGVALDYLIVRPAFWTVRHEPFRTIFGYRD
jgi:hypothetical protein